MSWILGLETLLFYARLLFVIDLFLLINWWNLNATIFLFTPPFTQLNTPYPATAYLKGFLNTTVNYSRTENFFTETFEQKDYATMESMTKEVIETIKSVKSSL